MPNDLGYKPVQIDSVEHERERRLEITERYRLARFEFNRRGDIPVDAQHTRHAYVTVFLQAIRTSLDSHRRATSIDLPR